MAKLESKAEVNRMRSDRGESAFWEAVQNNNLSSDYQDAMRQLIRAFPDNTENAPHWVWAVNAVFLVPAINRSRGVFALNRTGGLELYFGYHHEAKYPDMSQDNIRFRQGLSDGISKLFGTEFTAQQLQNFPTVKAERWVGKVGELVTLLNGLVG